MRIFTLSLIGLSALALSACDEIEGRRQARADGDCCCVHSCPTPAPVQTAQAPAVRAAPATSPPATGPGHHRRKPSHQWTSRGGERRYAYRSGTEGVGYLDEDLAGGAYSGGYRRAEVSVEESQSYSERRSSSESGYAYSASEGYRASGGSYRDGDRGGHRRRGHRDGGYVGVDRDGYLTWPGKTP